MAIVKKIDSDACDAAADVAMRIVEPSRALVKQASTVFECEYADIMPDARHVGIHVTALGESERYGFNRNADGFPKLACIQHHDTFVKFGHVYRHHRNKDPEKRLGQIVKSAYNPAMGRIELFIHVDRETASDELQKLARDGTISFSMACKVPEDRCSICGGLRKTSSDPDQCEHVMHKLGSMLDDGRYVGTYNDRPRFFDISFVIRPADRIAWDLKVASGAPFAQDADSVTVPDHVAIDTPSAIRKLGLLRKCAMQEREFDRLRLVIPVSTRDRYMLAMRKAASVVVPDALVADIAELSPGQVFHALADRRIIMDSVSFFKYALGRDFASIEQYMPELRARAHGIFSAIEKRARCQDVCMTEDFDPVSEHVSVPASMHAAAASCSFAKEAAEHRAVEASFFPSQANIYVDSGSRICSNGVDTVEVIAEKYAAYKLSAIRSIIDLHPDTDEDTLVALAVGQNTTGWR
jgi:hypothetical protein